MVTNQSGVARGLISEEELLRMNRYLMQQTGVDAVYYCPIIQREKLKNIGKHANVVNQESE